MSCIVIYLLNKLEVIIKLASLGYRVSHYVLAFYNEEKDKQIESDTTSYQHKSKKSKYSKIESSSFCEINGNSYRKKHQYSSDSSESNYRSRKKKYNPYEEISWELKNIKPPTFNGETEKERKPKHGFSE